MSDFLWKEAESLLCGARIGAGIAREVFELRTNPDYVIKIEGKGRSFQNIAEWESWSWIRGGTMEKWFAPCEMISSCGSMLIQRKCQPVRENELPKRLPAFLCDLKPDNFGLFKGRFVAVDYGTMTPYRGVSQRMVPVKWRM